MTCSLNPKFPFEFYWLDDGEELSPLLVVGTRAYEGDAVARDWVLDNVNEGGAEWMMNFLLNDPASPLVEFARAVTVRATALIDDIIYRDEVGEDDEGGDEDDDLDDDDWEDDEEVL